MRRFPKTCNDEYHDRHEDKRNSVSVLDISLPVAFITFDPNTRGLDLRNTVCRQFVEVSDMSLIIFRALIFSHGDQLNIIISLLVAMETI